MRSRGMWVALLATYAVLNCLLYALLLPLWEGFDEPFHFGYVERLATRGRLPVRGQTPMSREVMESLRLAPASPVVQRNLPFTTSFSEYFMLPAAERQSRREKLLALDPALRLEDAAGTDNYEAQQAPLAYLLLALPDRLWGNVPLAGRVLRLRLCCGLTASLAETGLVLWLAAMLGLAAPARYAAAFTVLSSQIFYACVARVSNDWLAIPLVSLVLVAAIRFRREPRYGNAILLGATLAAGALTKAYYLAWLLFGAGLMLWMAWRCASARGPVLAVAAIVAIGGGPWHARNVKLYGNLSGIMLARSDLGFGNELQALGAFSWPKVAAASARAALWSGNNSFTSFSVVTLDAALVLMLAAGAMWLWTARKPAQRADEWLVAGGCVCYVVALVYYCAMAFAELRDPGITVPPWYSVLLIAPLACLLFAGAERCGRAGRWTGAALVAISAYVLVATYVVKLIPLYGGYAAGRVRVGELWRWYTGSGVRDGLLGEISFSGAGVIWLLTAIVVTLAATICVLLARWWVGEAKGTSRCHEQTS